MAGYISETRDYKTAIVSAIDKASKTLTDNIFQANPLSAVLLKKGKMVPQAGGERIYKLIEYEKNNTIAPIARGGNVNLATSEKRTKAIYDWVTYPGSVTKYYEEVKEIRGPYQLRNLVTDELNNLVSTFSETFEGELFADGTTFAGKGMDGLEVAVPYTAAWAVGQSWGGLNPTAGSQTYWRNQTATMTGVSFAANWDQYFMTMDQDIIQQNGKTDLIVTNAEQFRYYKTECLGLKSIAYKTYLGDMGFQEVEYEGRPIVWSRSCGADRFYFLDTNHLYITYDPSRWFDRRGWVPKQDTLDEVNIIVCTWAFTGDKRKAQGIIAEIDTD